MIKKLVLFLLLLLTIIPCLRAQRKEISQARSYIKSGKELAKAEEILRKVIDNDSVSRNDPRVHSYLLQAIEKQYAEGNEKLYLKQKYDYIIVDTPPLGRVVDCAIEASLLDGVLIVVNAQNNSIKQIRRVKTQLEKTNGKILGVVLNKVSMRERGGYYGKAYGQYGSY